MWHFNSFSMSRTPQELELDHTIVWHVQGSITKSKPLEYYPTIEEIFTELSRKTKTKITIPKATKGINQPIVEPLTDQEKEEDYEVHIHINTFTFEDNPIEEKNLLQIANVPKEQQAMVLKKTTPWYRLNSNRRREEDSQMKKLRPTDLSML